MQQAEFGRIRLSYDVAGDGGSPVLLIMGYCVPGSAWRLQVPTLSTHHQVAWFDNRDVGGSRAPAGPWSMADLAGDARALLDHLGWSRAHVVGVSMGGMVAQHLALANPDRLVSLSLVATHAGGVRAMLPSARGALRFAGTAVGSTRRRMRNLERLLFPDDFLATCDRRWLREVMINDFGEPVPAGTRRDQLAAIRGHETASRLAELGGLPTLLVRSGRDLLIRPREVDRLARLLPHAKVMRFDAAGHGVIRQCADALNTAMLAHFAASDRSVMG